MASSSEFWNNTYALLVNKASQRKGIARLLRRRGMGVIQELMLTLNGVAAGSAALRTDTQVTATQHINDAGPGGVRTVAARDLVNRVTAAADVTDHATFFSQSTAPTYPTDASGNGGGGKGENV